MAAGAFFFKAAIQVLAVATVFWYLKGMDIGEIGDLREFTRVCPTLNTSLSNAQIVAAAAAAAAAPPAARSAGGAA